MLAGCTAKLVDARANSGASVATSSRRREVLDVPLPLDRSARNQSLQVHASLRAAILDGRLAAGIRLPSSRGLAEQLGVGRNSVVIAYEHLLGDGLIEARQGAGTYVAMLPKVGPQSESADAVNIEMLPRGPLAIGRTYGDPALLQRLASAIRRRIAMASQAELGYGDPRGSLDLRNQLAAHLAASRGVLCDPACVLITNGTQQGLRLCIDALLRLGDSVWMEDPGYPTARHTLQTTGMRIVPVPVDAEGLDTAAGRRVSPHAKAAYITPSHQFPMGVTMSMRRRVALIDWARETGAWLLEDDYDSEFRYAGPPLTALAGLGGNDRVIYLGTFSKTLFPALRLAYVVLPRAIVEVVLRARGAQDRVPQLFAADAVADLMVDGTIAAHTRRIRRRYRMGRDTLVAALEAASGATLRVIVPTQGLHLVALLPPGLPSHAAADIRKTAGVDIWLLSETRVVPAEPDGFILGFSGQDVADLRASGTALGLAAREYVRSLDHC
jgi:GntR family transcriptional regulator / MocR family aminotransferase